MGFTAAELEAVGIAPSLAGEAIHSPGEEALLVAVSGALVPPWQADVLLALATGTALRDVLEGLGVDVTGASTSRPQAASEHADAEAVDAALDRPGSQMDFVRIETDDELRRVLDGSFAEWRVFLHPEQRRYAYSPTTGSYRLSGGAGTGKTVVALHRARHLAGDSGARVVLTTFTRTLAENLARDLRALDATVAQVRLGGAGVTVRGIDQLALDVLAGCPRKSASRWGATCWQVAASPRQCRTRTSATPGRMPPTGLGSRETSRGPPSCSVSTAWWSWPEILTTREAYLRVARPGRGVRLSRASRILVWTAVETYRRQLTLDQTASFAEIATLAARCADALAAREGRRLVDHVIVDEAQDLHPGHWRLLRSLTETGPNDLFIAEDGHQRIYGERVVLSRCGIAIRGRSRRLTLNYRTTAQNLQFAVNLLAGADTTDLEGGEESVAGYRSAMRGPAPVLRACTGLSEELDVAEEAVRAWLSETDVAGRLTVEPATVGILTRAARQRDLVAQGLRDRGLAAHVVAAHDSGRTDAPRLMTMHRAKGLEFSRVVLFGVDRKSLPSEHVLAGQSPEEQADARNRERFLLYVAASRARDALVVIWSGEASPFLPAEHLELAGNALR